MGDKDYPWLTDTTQSCKSIKPGKVGAASAIFIIPSGAPNDGSSKMHWKVFLGYPEYS